MSRRVELQGLRNFRDLGGFNTHDGRRTATGRLFRSDGLHRVSAADLRLLEAMSIRRVYDLRSQIELDNDGVGPFAGAAGRHRHMPLIKVSLNPYDPDLDWKTMDLRNRYYEMLCEGAATIAAILGELSVAGCEPAVFHCSGGKDRTGVLAAVILRSLGVADDDIVADYALSERYLSPVVERYREAMEAGGIDEETVSYLISSPPERMIHTLNKMDECWGGIRGYLDAIGVSERQVRGLERNLLI